MELSRAKDVALAKEVLYMETFQFKERTVQCVQEWLDVVKKTCGDNLGNLTDSLLGSKVRDGLANQKPQETDCSRAQGQRN